MTMTDPIADMLTRIRNASSASHDSVNMSTSRIKAELARILKEEGYILDYGIEGNDLEIQLKYGPKRERVISHIERISRPGLRRYSGSEKLPRVLGGNGTAIISTSQGLMTDGEARTKNIGGEIICYVW